jgi:hypothetical protein
MRWLPWINFFIFSMICFLLVGMGIIELVRPRTLVYNSPVLKQWGLPAGAFTLSSQAYSHINEPFFHLQFAPPTTQLPDLRAHLFYYGKNGRPDAQSDRTYLHFSLNGNRTIASISPGEKLYLQYNKKNLPSHYVFSPQNKETSLWIEPTLQNDEVLIHLFSKNEKGEILTEPETHAQFKLPEKEFIRFAGAAWELGPWKVDGTLLARQRAKWFGPDRFLEQHGGEDYQHTLGKQRIDFGENEDIYSVFVSTGDCLIWDQNRWKIITPGATSLNYPLMVVKKIDERLMGLELWDIEGKGKLNLNLLKSIEPWMSCNAQTIKNTFKFVGARTKTQCIFEINQERMLVSPSDWLLFDHKGWKRLTTEEDIDRYVKRQVTGMLFVFEGLKRKEDHQVMLGTLYNTSRSDSQTVELAILQGGTSKNTASQEQEIAPKIPHNLVYEPETPMQRPDIVMPPAPPPAAFKKQPLNF